MRHLEHSRVIPSAARDRSTVHSDSMFVYILTNRTRRLYVGVTNDLVRRVYEHRMHCVPGFTQRYNIDRLVYFESISEAAEAIAREKQIKDYARAKKLAMITWSNPEWTDLAKTWFVAVSMSDSSLRSE
jgi:putative endonuclease